MFGSNGMVLLIMPSEIKGYFEGYRRRGYGRLNGHGLCQTIETVTFFKLCLFPIVIVPIQTIVLLLRIADILQ